jgi:RNA methyltransferase, TrmH family
MAIRIIESKQNTRVKELRAALLRPSRGHADAIGIEGLHLVAEAVQSGLQIASVFIASGHEHLLETLRLPASVELLSMPADILASAVTTEAPQPIAALAQPPASAWESAFTPQSLVVVLAGIQDPGNLGTILRSAEAFGASCAISLPGTVSQWNPKAMRASAGSVFRLPVLTATPDECFNRLHTACIQTIAAMAHNATPLDRQNLATPTAFLIGSEGSGLSPELAARCDARVTIPCPGPVESLNAAVAASILLYEASRQTSRERGRAQ